MITTINIDEKNKEYIDFLCFRDKTSMKKIVNTLLDNQREKDRDFKMFEEET